MNETMKSIMQRRSIRNYSEKKIPDDDLKLILQAGLNAPSACNEQTWHFTVMRSKERIDALSAEVKKSLVKSEIDWVKKLGETETFHVFYNAPVVILVSKEKQGLNPAADVSAAIENMLIAAQSLGIDSCWIGMTAFHFKNYEDQRPYMVPESYLPTYAVALGYGAGERQPGPERREGTVNWLD